MLAVTQLIGFGAGMVEDIAIINDGDAAPSSGAGTAALTFGSQTSTGPTSVLLINWESANNSVTLDSATWNGVAMSILAQVFSSGAGMDVGAAIAIISGAQSGDVVLNFSATVDDAEITKVSLTNVQSIVAVDTDTSTAQAATVSLTALASPGVGGIRLAANSNGVNTTAITWTNGTELSDLDAGGFRHSAAYDLGDDATTISAGGGTGAAHRNSIAGVSIR